MFLWVKSKEIMFTALKKKKTVGQFFTPFHISLLKQPQKVIQHCAFHTRTHTHTRFMLQTKAGRQDKNLTSFPFFVVQHPSDVSYFSVCLRLSRGLAEAFVI